MKREDVALAERTETTGQAGPAGDFGANEWLVDELWKQYQVDKNSVDRSWWPVLEKYGTTAQVPDHHAGAARAHDERGSP
jgi:2-oxoglutarate dehydrogenase E1 component